MLALPTRLLLLPLQMPNKEKRFGKAAAVVEPGEAYKEGRCLTFTLTFGYSLDAVRGKVSSPLFPWPRKPLGPRPCMQWFRAGTSRQQPTESFLTGCLPACCAGAERVLHMGSCQGGGALHA